MTKIAKYLPILAIIFFSLIPLFWFKHGYIFARGDNFPVWLNSLNTFFSDNFIWESAYNGQLSDWLRYVIFGGLWYFLQVIHIPIDIIQISVQILYFLIGGLSIYFLYTTIYKDQKVAALVASSFYIFNFYMIVYITDITISWVTAFLPLILAFYVRIINNLKKSESPAKNIIGFAVVSTIISSFSSRNPPLVLSILLAFWFIFVYYLITECEIRDKIIKNLVLLSALCFLINIWWITPFILSFISTKTITFGTVISTDVTNWYDKYGYVHQRASFLNLFWLNGAWGWSRDYYTYFDAYSNPILKLLTFVPALIAFTGLLFTNNNRKINTYFVFVILVLIFLSKGLHSPLQNINLFLYNYVPGFFAFREPFPKFYLIVIIFLALLIGSSYDSIINTIQKKKFKYKNATSNLFVAFIVVSFIISTFPLITGQVIDPLVLSEGTFPTYIQIPDYWYQTANNISSDTEDFRVLITPEDDFYMMPYKWGYYGADALPSRLITKPILQQQYTYIINNNYKRMVTAAYGGIKENLAVEFNNTLALFNVKYIIQRNDIQWNLTGKNIVSPITIKSFLSHQENIKLVKTFGEIDIYEVSDNFPHVYTVPAQITVHTFDDFMQLLNTSDFTPGKQNIIVSYQNQNKTLSERDYNIRPHIFFQKINPTKYKIKIESVHEPFYLTFSESYHPGWQAYINTDSMQCNPIALYENLNVTECEHESKFFEIKDLTRLFGKAIPEENHLLVNGYANAWYIDPQELGTGENFTITLYFKPQSYYYIGLIISGLTFLGCVAYVVLDWRKRVYINM